LDVGVRFGDGRRAARLRDAIEADAAVLPGRELEGTRGEIAEIEGVAARRPVDRRELVYIHHAELRRLLGRRAVGLLATRRDLGPETERRGARRRRRTRHHRHRLTAGGALDDLSAGRNVGLAEAISRAALPAARTHHDGRV